MIQLVPHFVGSAPYLKAADAIANGEPPRVGAEFADATRRAVVAAQEVLSTTPYRVQVAAALGLLDGHAVEMKTGEGKTLAVLLAASAFAQRGAHVTVVTANDYLAERDAEGLRAAYARVGVDVGLVLPSMTHVEKRSAYDKAVVYASLRTAVFDWMRDGLQRVPWREVQGRRDVLLIDEVDAALIDEASVPFVVSQAGAPADHELLRKVDHSVMGLVPERDFVREGDHQVSPTEAGWDRVERALRVDGLLVAGESLMGDGAALLNAVTNAHHAHAALERDRHYIVDREGVHLLDANTGRVAVGRRWGFGLQQAVEVKEHVPPSALPETRASTAASAFVRQFKRVAGLSGTAADAAEELFERYGMATLVIPTHRPSIRVDLPDVVFPSGAERRAAMVEALAEHQRASKPVLVGTWSVVDALSLSRALHAAAVPHRTLTARDEPDEAAVIAQAAAPGAITIATQLAGRGTDIVLGGDSRAVDPACASQVRALGGLRVWLYGRGATRRQDQQLRGRAGRQGDPGETRAWLGADDLRLAEAEGVSIDKLQLRTAERERSARHARHAFDVVVEQHRCVWARMREETLYGVTRPDAERLVARWNTSSSDARASLFTVAPPGDRWWSEAIVPGLLGAWNRHRSAERGYSLNMFAAEILRSHGVAPRVALVQSSPQPARLLACLVREAMLEGASRARAALVSTDAGGTAAGLLDARFRASRPRHVLRLARVLGLEAYDEAWMAFLAEVPTLMDRAMIEREGRANAPQMFQRLTHQVFERAFEESRRQVGEALLRAPTKLTAVIADEAGVAWLRTGRDD